MPPTKKEHPIHNHTLTQTGHVIRCIKKLIQLQLFFCLHVM
jgi:hypothetical protein